VRSLALALMLAVFAAGCPKAGGDYAQTDRMGGADRGETNGRMFDLIANMPDGDDWQVRIRDDSMWVSYSNGDDVDDLGTRGLTAKEARRVWDLIDNVDIASRKKGKKNADEGYYQLKLREPGEEGEDGVENHVQHSIFVSRDTDDDDITALSQYLVKLIGKYHPKYRKDEADI
jgi:hypothetical protein